VCALQLVHSFCAEDRDVQPQVQAQYWHSAETTADRQAQNVVNDCHASDTHCFACLCASSAEHMDAIPYVDSLIKEYLLFRGFTGTLRAFNKDLSSDRGCGFQADQLCDLVFRRLVPLDQASELMEVLDFLNSRVYSRLPGSCEEVIRKLEVTHSAKSR